MLHRKGHPPWTTPYLQKFIRPDLPEVREVTMKIDDQTTTMQHDYLTCCIDSGTDPKVDIETAVSSYSNSWTPLQSDHLSPKPKKIHINSIIWINLQYSNFFGTPSGISIGFNPTTTNTVVWPPQPNHQQPRSSATKSERNFSPKCLVTASAAETPQSTLSVQCPPLGNRKKGTEMGMIIMAPVSWRICSKTKMNQNPATNTGCQ